MDIIRPLLLSDQQLISRYLTQYPPEVSELTFTNLFVWRHSRPVYYMETDRSLSILVKESNPSGRYIILGKILGNITLPEMSEMLGNRLAGAVRQPETSIIFNVKSDTTISADRDNADYVYRVADLGELSGRKYAKKRNQVKQCQQKYSCEYEPITPKNIPECLAMQGGWCQIRNCGHTPGLCEENKAIEEIFNNYDKFNLFGGAIRVNGKILAYSIAEQLHHGTAVCHFEKAMPDIQGLGQLITHWFAKYSLTNFEFFNREQDLGIPGLRQAKESYYPHHLVHKYSVIFMGEKELKLDQVKQCAFHEKL